MRYLRKFNEALSASEISKIEDTFYNHFSRDYEGSFTINPEDGTIDIAPDTHISFGRGNLVDDTKLPLKFGNVRRFHVYSCLITTLEGSPHTSGFFRIYDTQITDLVGGPKTVGRYILTDNRQLVSLRGLGQDIAALEILGSPITSLEGCPSYIYNYFSVEETEITDLVGGPKEINDGDCHIGGEKITSLEGIPNVGGSLELVCPNVYDPSPLRNLEVKNGIQIWGPIASLVAFFYTIDGKGDYDDFDDGFFTIDDSWEKFKNSLDYNYVRQKGEEWVIIHFKFLEALSELDITPEDLDSDIREMFMVGDYWFMDEEGDHVNLGGEKIN